MDATKPARSAGTDTWSVGPLRKAIAKLGELAKVLRGVRQVVGRSGENRSRHGHDREDKRVRPACAARLHGSLMNTPVESTTIASPTPAPKRRNHRKAHKPFDGRFAIGRRVRELIDVFRARIGPEAADPIMSTAIRRCAETVALSEDLRGRMLRGEAVSADDVLRTTRAADALTRRLHLDRHTAKPPTTTLSDYLRARGWIGSMAARTVLATVPSA